MRDWKEALVLPTATIKETMQKIDETSLQFAAVVSESGELLGTVTDGDIRRALLNNYALNTVITLVMNKKPTTISSEKSEEEQQEEFMKLGVKQLPVVNHLNHLKFIWFAPQYLYKKKTNTVVLMAGGLGTRLRPLTNTVPKPMLPIGGKPILELIIENFKKYGFYRFVLTVNYKKEIIQNYFQDGSAFGVEITYIEEVKPLGTAGALSLLKEEFMREPIFLMNGDIITDVNFETFLQFHVDEKAIATVCTRAHEYQLPYGVLETEGYVVKTLYEKPTYKQLINTGIYILSKEAIACIPDHTFYNTTQLLNDLLQNEQAVLSYEVENYWLDIGQLEEYESVKDQKLKD